jgi:outer membrane protein assembly factor BamA
MAGDMYIGAAGRNNAVRVQLEGEGRLNNQMNQWEGVIASARATQYLKTSRINTMTASLEFSGSWRQRTPFALILGDQDGGVRGFASSRTPGAQRMVGRLEDRLFIGRPNNAADFGIGFFSDAGRLWAGDVPYGVTTPVRYSVGISLLGTAPAGSARLWRLDLAYAMNPEVGRRRFELRIGSTNKATFFLPEPADLQSGREKTVPTSVFRWPQ